VIFRSVSGGTANLDDYLPIDGSVAMTGELQADTKVTAKVKGDGSVFETAVVMAEGWRSGATTDAARITLSNKYNANSYTTINYKGTSGTNGVLTFDRAKIEFNRLGNNRDGFTIKGRSDVGGTWNNDNTLLGVYYNQGTGDNRDAINYFGKQESNDNLATVGYVKTTRAMVRESFEKLQRAVADETTVEGIKEALVNALGGIIEELEAYDAE
jgi:hypothetical protein